MKQNTLAYSVIRSMVEKIIHDVNEDPSRGAKGLINLGALFADTQGQKDVLAVVGAELQRRDSAYYQIVQRVVAGTDPELLTSFGMNLGYQCLSQGGKTIRRLEARSGVAIPWCLLFETEPDRPLDLSVVSEAVRQGKEMGIFAYLFFLDRQAQGLGRLIKLAREQPDCAFLLFLPPAAVTRELADALLAGKNACALVSLGGQDVAPAKAALELLRSSRCLYGGWGRYNSFSAQAPAAMARAAELGASILVMVDKKNSPVGPESDNRPLTDLRMRLPRPVFPVDLYRDIAQADRNQDGLACRAVVQADGRVVLVTPEGVELGTGDSILNTPLIKILTKGRAR